MDRLDADRFARLWADEESAVVRLVYHRLPGASFDDRDDVLQATRLRAWSTFDDSLGKPFGRWVRRLASLACTDWIRETNAIKRSAAFIDDLPPDRLLDLSPSPFDLATWNEISPALAHAVADLIPRHRRALRLFAAEADLREIGAALGCTPARASAIVNAARSKVAAYLA